MAVGSPGPCPCAGWEHRVPPSSLPPALSMGQEQSWPLGLPSPCQGGLASGWDVGFGVCRGRAGPAANFQGEKVTPSRAPAPNYRPTRVAGDASPPAGRDPVAPTLQPLHFSPKELGGGLIPDYRGGVRSKIAQPLPGGGCAPQPHSPLLPRGGCAAREPSFPFIATM